MDLVNLMIKDTKLVFGKDLIKQLGQCTAAYKTQMDEKDKYIKEFTLCGEMNKE